MRNVVATLYGVLAALLVGCASSAQEQLAANKALVRQFAASVDAGDWAALDTLVAEDVRRHSRATTANPEIRSREQFKRHEEARHTPWPDGHVTYEIMVAEGDFVAAYATFTGTQRGQLGVFPPTGRSVETKFLALFRIDDGQIAEIWVEWDNITTRPVGAVPSRYDKERGLISRDACRPAVTGVVGSGTGASRRSRGANATSVR